MRRAPVREIKPKIKSLSCQEDSEDGEMCRRAAEEMLMEAEQSTEDGEQADGGSFRTGHRRQ